MHHPLWIVSFFLIFCLLISYGTPFPSGLCRTAIVTSTPIPPGPICGPNGGEMITITCFNSSVSYPVCNVTSGGGGNSTIYASNVIFYPSVPSHFNNATQTTVDVALDLLGARSNPLLIGGNFISITSLNASAFLFSFTGSLTSAGIGFSLIADGPTLSLNDIEAGSGIFLSQVGNDIVIEADISFASSEVGGTSLIFSAGPSFLTLNELQSTVPLLTFSSSAGLITLSSSVFCADGRPSLLFNGSAYCQWQVDVVAGGANCNGAAAYVLSANSTTLSAVCAAGSLTVSSGPATSNCTTGTITFSSPTTGTLQVCAAGSSGSGSSMVFLNSTTVLFYNNGSVVSAQAILTLSDATSGGASLISSVFENTGVLRQIFSAIPGLSLLVNTTSITLANPIICSDGRPSIVFNGTTCCNWYFAFGAPTSSAPSGTVLFVSDAVNTSWPLPGPAPYIPANPLLWPANITIVDQALNYLGIYRAQNGVCPSGGQSMITVNGISVCAVRIDPGPATATCPAGTYTFDSGIATATVCQPFAMDAYDVSFVTNNPSFFSQCSVDPAHLSTYVNCLGSLVQPLINNVTGANTVYYYPPRPLFCQSNVTLSAVLTFLITTQSPNATFNVYVNPVTGNDTCGAGTFANPWRTIAYALTQLTPTDFQSFHNIILTVGVHTVIGDLYIPPNVQFMTLGSLRYTTINVTGNIYLATPWSLFANDVVKAGFTDITLMFGSMYFDFTTMGAYGPSSEVVFSLQNCIVDGTGTVTFIGRGSTDHIHFNNDDLNVPMSVNCMDMHLEISTTTASVTIYDANCTTPIPQAFTYIVNGNFFKGLTDLNVYQNTSTTEVDFFGNAFDGGFLNAYSPNVGSLIMDVYGLPLNYYFDPGVTKEYRENFAGIRLCNLNPTYWGATCLNGDELMSVLQGYAKTLATSGSGTVSLIASSTITTNTLRELTSGSPYVSWYASGGVVALNFTSPVLVYVSNGVTCYNQSGSTVCNTIYSTFGATAECPLGGLLEQTYAGNYSICTPFVPDATGVIYTSVPPFRGLSTFSVAYGFDVIFQEVLPSITGIWWVDPVHGDDSLGSGAPNNKLRTIAQAFSMIGTFPFTQMQTVMLVPGVYTESGLLWPPNTFVRSAGSMEETLVIISGANVDLRSDWSTYANDLVEGGIQEIQWKSDKFIIDYAGVEGAAGGYSNSRFAFVRSVVDAVFIINGRGNTDHVDFILTTVSLQLDSNCLDMNIQSSTFLTNVNINDSPCPVSDIFVQLRDNYFYDASTFTLTHSDSTNFKVTSLFNSFSTITTTQFLGKPNLYANGLPLNLFLGPSVTLINDFNAKGVVQSGLPTPYFASSTMNQDDINLALSTYAKTLVNSGAGAVSLIFSTTSTTNTLNGLTGTTNQVTVAATGGGAILFSTPSTFVAPGNIQDTTGLYLSTTNSISAAGATQGTATALTKSNNIITTVAASTGVALPTPAKAGFRITVENRGANTLNVYPASGGTIDSAAVNVAVTIPVGAAATYLAATTTQWYTIAYPIVAGTTATSVAYGNGQVTVGSTVLPLLFSNTATLTQTNPGAAVFVSVIPAGAGTLTIPANVLTAGSKITIFMNGYISFAAASTFTFRYLLDGVTIYTSAATAAPGASTNVRLSMKGDWNTFTSGVSGTMLGSGYLNAFTASCAIVSVATTVYDTTVTHTFGMQAAFSAANAANTFTITSFRLSISKI